MQYQRQIGFPGNNLYSVKIQLGRKCIVAMRIADCNSQRINTCALYIVNGCIRIRKIILRIGKLAGTGIVADMSKLCFHSHTHCMTDLYHLRNFGDIFFIRCCRAVIHNRSKAQLDSLHTAFKGQTVIIVDTYRNRGFFCHRDQVIGYQIKLHRR